MYAIIYGWPVLLPALAEDRATIMHCNYTENKIFKRFTSCSRGVELYQQYMCSWTVAVEDLSPLPAPTGEQKRARDKQKKTVEDRNRKKIEKEKKVSIKKGEPLTEHKTTIECLQKEI